VVVVAHIDNRRPQPLWDTLGQFGGSGSSPLATHQLILVAHAGVGAAVSETIKQQAEGVQGPQEDDGGGTRRLQVVTDIMRHDRVA